VICSSAAGLAVYQIRNWMFGRGWRRFRHSSAAATVRVLLATDSSAVGDGFAIWVLLAMFRSSAAGLRSIKREIGL
jgi:hypothetical protein